MWSDGHVSTYNWYVGKFWLFVGGVLAEPEEPHTTPSVAVTCPYILITFSSLEIFRVFFCYCSWFVEMVRGRGRRRRVKTIQTLAESTKCSLIWSLNINVANIVIRKHGSKGSLSSCANVVRYLKIPYLARRRMFPLDVALFKGIKAKHMFW